MNNNHNRKKNSDPISLKWMSIPLLGVFVLLVGFPKLINWFTDYWWFESVGYARVLVAQSTSKIGLAIAGGLFSVLFFEVNMWLASKATRSLPALWEGDVFQLEGIDLNRLLSKWIRPLSWGIGILMGFSLMIGWEELLQFMHRSDFGDVDPIFQKDVGFFLFVLPFLEQMQSFFFWTVLFGVLLVGMTFISKGAFRVAEGRVQSITAARRHLFVLVALVFALLGVGAWIRSIHLVYSSLGPVTGASYADVHAKLPGLRLEMAAAFVGTFAMIVSIFRKRFTLSIAAFVLYGAVHLLAVRAYPAMVHKLSVLPNEAVKEAPYIEYNIAATRKAFGIHDVKEEELTGDKGLTKAEIERHQPTIQNIRLWDQKPLLDTFTQIQEIRTYYEFASVDNDRYLINGNLTQVLLSPREISNTSLPNRTWINEHFTFTHGYGMTLGPVNQATKEGLPVLYVRDIPPVSEKAEIQVTKPAIYFGELTNEHVFVNTLTKEFDYPSGEDNVYADYTGEGGVSIGSFLRKLAFCIRFGSFKLLLSQDIKAESKVLLYRNIQERVRMLAPFLRFDRDPYIVIRDDGSLAWIQDAYTSSNRYPFAEKYNGINYIRNSVKIVIDAYNGKVGFYISEPKDPMIQTWKKVFPSMFQDLESMPEDLQKHLRYPEDLFQLQANVFSVYHMKEAELVYNREDQWEVPLFTKSTRTKRMDPYYTVMQLPGELTPEFILMLPFTPKLKANLAAWMVARMDGEHRGEIISYRFPKDKLVFGPQQIMNRIQQDADISGQVSLWDQRGSEAEFGTLLVIPIEESLIYVCPLYLRSSGGKIPELKRVIAVYENKIAMEKTLEGALDQIFKFSKKEESLNGESEKAEEISVEQPSSGMEKQIEEISANLDIRLRAFNIYRKAVTAQREGDWEAYGKSLAELEQLLQQMANEVEK